jgi:hypothetical protein
METNEAIAELKSWLARLMCDDEPTRLEDAVTEALDALTAVQRCEVGATCDWRYLAEDGVWFTACKSYWCFDDGEPPAIHDCHYCSKCGKRIQVVSGSESVGEASGPNGAGAQRKDLSFLPEPPR